MKKVFTTFIVLSSLINLGFSQVSCPAVTAGPDTTLSGPGCVRLQASPVSGFQTTSYTTQQIPYSPYPYNQGTPILLNIDDEWSSVITIPFNFCFYGNSYNQLIIGSNGVISFDLSNAGGFNQWMIGNPIPSPQNPTNAIYAPFHDINPSISGTIRWNVFGTAPCRVFVVSFQNCPMFSPSCNNLIATQQIALYETTNIIETYIQNKPLCTNWNGGAAIHGIQNATGTLATVIPGRNYPTQWTATNDAWRFIPAGAPNFQINWYQGGNLIANTDTVTVCPGNCTMEYVAEVIYTNCDNSTITVSDTATITIANTQFSFNPVVTDNLCAGDSLGAITVSPTGGIAPYTYQWSTGDTTATASNLPAGIYSISILDSGGCNFIDYFQINEPSSLQTSITGTDVTCFGGNDGSATIMVSGGVPPYQYAWSPTGGTNATATNLTDSTYYCTVTDSNGCTIIDSVEINTANILSVDFVATDTCDGIAVQFTNQSSGGTIVGWNWSFGDNSSSSLASPGHVYPAAGTYTATLIATNSVGCIDSAQHQVEIYPNPIANFTADTVCFGEATSFVNTSTISAGNISSWNWDFGDNNTSTLSSPSYTYANEGVYTTTLIATSSLGCADTIQQQVEVYAKPIASFLSDSACLETGISFVNQSTITLGNISNHNWDFGDNTTSSLISPTHTYDSTGAFTVTLIVSSNKGCADTTRKQVEIYPNPIANFTADTVCFGTPTSFTDSSTIASGSILAWSWDFGGGNISTQQNPNYIFPSYGTNSASLVVTSEFGCTDALTLPIEVIAPPEISTILHDSVCRGYPASLAISTPSGVTVSWYLSNTSPDPFYVGTEYTTAPLNTTVFYYLEAREDELGCTGPRIPIWGYVYPVLQPGGLIVSNREVEIPNAIVSFEMSNPVNINSWNWSFGDGGSSTSPNPAYQYNESGLYDVSLILEDIYGCIYEYFYDNYIEVKEINHVFVPTAFSPNGDGVNDYFMIYTRLISNLEIQIYDRWGRLVYASNLPDMRWNGEDINGLPLPEGVYAWKLKATTYSGGEIKKSGTLTLLR